MWFLTIGMAVDANVLIFERIKEELKSGKGQARAIELGYQRAFSAIIDANITTLIAAVILFHHGVWSCARLCDHLGVGDYHIGIHSHMGHAAVYRNLAGTFQNQKDCEIRRRKVCA